jgi:hypothetical protein
MAPAVAVAVVVVVVVVVVGEAGVKTRDGKKRETAQHELDGVYTALHRLQ